MTTKRDLEIMEYVDGEAELELDTGARAKAGALRELGELVRGRLELAADDVADQRFAAMWREIDRETATTTRARPGFLHRMSRAFEKYRSHMITGVVSAGAVAAFALVFRGSSSTPQVDHEPINVRPVAHRPVEIESLDTPGGNGTVFRLDDEDGSTTVIWVTPEDTVEGI